MPHKIVRPKEAQRRLGIGHTKFYELVNAGRLQVVHIGQRCTGVPEHELDAFISGLIAARDDATAA